MIGELIGVINEHNHVRGDMICRDKSYTVHSVVNKTS